MYALNTSVILFRKEKNGDGIKGGRKGEREKKGK